MSTPVNFYESFELVFEPEPGTYFDIQKDLIYDCFHEATVAICYKERDINLFLTYGIVSECSKEQIGIRH